MAEMLDTREAAELLGVSEASVRRWGDGGLFPMQRVGQRRQRRFRRDDLLAFLERGSQPARGHSSDVVWVGGGVVPMGSHFATFYASDAGRLRIAIPFLREGLALGQPCVLIASGERLDRYIEALEADLGGELAEATRRGLFAIVPAPGSTVETALAFWEDRVGAATSPSGPAALRAVGDMASEKQVFPTVEQMLTYEHLLSVLIKRLATVIVCQYDVREFDGPPLLEAIKAHPDGFRLGIEKLIG
jgi:excisionase family DNA binding protein